MDNLTPIPNEWGKYYTSYRGLWYRYHPLLEQWWISDTKNGSQNVWTFNANLYRIDQCFKRIFTLWTLCDEAGQWKSFEPSIKTNGFDYKYKQEGNEIIISAKVLLTNN